MLCFILRNLQYEKKYKTLFKKKVIILCKELNANYFLNSPISCFLLHLSYKRYKNPSKERKLVSFNIKLDSGENS